MITVKEIARRCGVSATTVSNILNGKPKVSEETRQRVLDVIRETGYQPNYIAQGLRNRKTRMIGIIAEDIAQFSTPPIIEGMMEFFESRAYRTIVQNLRLYARWSDQWYEKDAEYHSILDPVLQELRSLNVDGIIYVAGHARVIHCFPENFEIPAVMAYAYSDDPKIPCVVVDDEKGSFQIIQYLLHAGHKKIGIIGGRQDNIHTQKRLEGYRRAFLESGLSFEPEWIRYASWNREKACAETKALLEMGVTAVAAMTDAMAGGVYDALEEAGKKPGEDISVTGFDNQMIAGYFRPGLTTMALPLLQVGEKAAEVMLEKIDGTAKGRLVIPCTLVERGSVRRR